MHTSNRRHLCAGAAAAARPPAFPSRVSGNSHPWGKQMCVLATTPWCMRVREACERTCVGEEFWIPLKPMGTQNWWEIAGLGFPLGKVQYMSVRNRIKIHRERTSEKNGICSTRLIRTWILSRAMAQGRMPLSVPLAILSGRCPNCTPHLHTHSSVSTLSSCG